MLSLSQILTYTLALGVTAAVPGPGMTALVARTTSSGALCGFFMLFGLVLGDLFYLSLAVFGLAIIAHQFAFLFVVIKWGACVYLLYLAVKLWLVQPDSHNPHIKIGRKDLFASWLSGLTITLANPKAIGFYMAILPLVISLETVSLVSWAFILVPVTVTILIIVGGTYVVAALQLRQVLASPKAQKIMFRSAAIMMAIASITMMFK